MRAILREPGAASRDDAIFKGDEIVSSEGLLQERERTSPALNVNFSRKLSRRP